MTGDDAWRGGDLSQRLAREIALSVCCLRCKASFAAEDVIVVGHRAETWLAAVICSHCALQGVIFAHAHTRCHGEELSELTPSEAQAFALRPAIGMAEVLQIRTALNQLDGDLTALWH